MSTVKGQFQQFEWLDTVGVAFAYVEVEGRRGVVVTIADKISGNQEATIAGYFLRYGYRPHDFGIDASEGRLADGTFISELDQMSLAEWESAQRVLEVGGGGQSLLVEMLAAADARAHSIVLKLAGNDRELAAHRFFNYWADASEVGEVGDFVWVGTAEYLDEDELAERTGGLDAEVFYYEMKARVWGRKSHARKIAARLADADGFEAVGNFPPDFEALNESLADFITESEQQAQDDFEEAAQPDGSYDFEVEIQVDHWEHEEDLSEDDAAAFWAQSDWTPEDGVIYGSVNTHARRWLR